MMPAHFHRMVLAEVSLVFRRWSGRAAIVLAVLVPVIVSLVMGYASQKLGQAEVVGEGMTALVDLNLGGVMKWSLYGRNFFFLPVVLVLATATAVSGELGDKTLRSLAWRPVSRSSLLLAKVCALLGLAACTLVVTYLAAFIGGASVFGLQQGDVSLVAVSQGYAVSVLSDLGLIALTTLVGSFTGRVGRATVSLVVLLMVDKAAMLLLKGMGMLGVGEVDGLEVYLPGSALECWKGWDPAVGWVGEQFVGLMVLLLLALGGSVLRFRKMDIA